jgi:hypothetical protein
LVVLLDESEPPVDGLLELEPPVAGVLLVEGVLLVVELLEVELVDAFALLPPLLP